MAKSRCSRTELLKRWSEIQEEQEDDGHSPTKQCRVLRLKEEWFSDSFNFLVNLPKDKHVWCSCQDLMGPLLDTFCDYFGDKNHDSPPKLLWRRVSQELGYCTQCICQYHQAQELYTILYDAYTVEPLLRTLRCLDEERITEHLKDINARMHNKEYNAEINSAEVVSLMFEVLMFPTFFLDQSLVKEFQLFIEAIDESHEIVLSSNQQYPGVYALLFLKSGRSRAVGFRLAGSMGKLRKGTDLDPLQPLLKAYIGFLEVEMPPYTLNALRPRVQLECLNVWHGIKTLLGFLEVEAFEDGILEKYPTFLNILLNHVSDDTVEFSCAVTCLQASFEMLGCKLWLRTILSPSMVHNILLGHCFHTRNEKSHKDIFDLFLPFLQSLEALEDGEYEKQQRHLIYFLLHQVTHSRNFSVLMREHACKIALLIIYRGYTMNPPCPPFECVHIWGPALINSMKEPSLHISLRQAAFNLINIILVSDASALNALQLKNQETTNTCLSTLADFIDDEDEKLFSHNCEVNDGSCWGEFDFQNKLIARVCKQWACAPMLWFEALINADPSLLSITFSKAVFWTLSHISILELGSALESSLSLEKWLSTEARKISSSFGWEVPNGSDDVGERIESRNCVEASSMTILLTKTLKRFAAHFIQKMEQQEFYKQWTWESKMAESIILLLIVPDDSIRQADTTILKYFSRTSDLTTSLQFLCSTSASLCAVFSGLRFALEQVLADSLMNNFHAFHHLFLILRKLLKEVVAFDKKSAKEDSRCVPSLLEGESLSHHFTENLPVETFVSVFVDTKSWEKFSCSVSIVIWPLILKCLEEGKSLLNSKDCQMTCVRLLETLPVVFERTYLPSCSLPGSLLCLAPDAYDFKWLLSLVEWGNSSLIVVIRHWKQCIFALLNYLKGSQSGKTQSTLGVIDSLLSHDNVPVGELKEKFIQIFYFSRSASTCEQITSRANTLLFDPFLEKRSPASQFTTDKLSTKLIRAADVIVLSEDEQEEMSSPALICVGSSSSDSRLLKPFPSGKPISSHALSSPSQVHDGLMMAEDVIILSEDEQENMSSPALICKGSSMSSGMPSKSSSEPFPSGKNISSCELPSRSQVHDVLIKAEDVIVLSEDEQEEMYTRTLTCRESLVSGSMLSKGSLGHFLSGKTTNTYELSCQSHANDVSQNSNVLSKVESSIQSSTSYLVHGKNTDLSTTSMTSDVSSYVQKDKSTAQQIYHQSPCRSISSLESEENLVFEQLVHNDEDNPLKITVDKLRQPWTMATTHSISVPKRQAVHLNLSVNVNSGLLSRPESVVRRLKPPRLDNWYKLILELDYFSLVGLTSDSENARNNLTKLKEVPLCFQSSKEYVEIFKPLILEEFKAQLQKSYLDSSIDEMVCGSLCLLSVERMDDFLLVRGCPDNPESFSSRVSDNDLVLLSKESLQNASKNVYLLGKVERREKTDKSRTIVLTIRFYLPKDTSRFGKARTFLIERSKWFLSRLLSITPQLREFQALSSLNDIPMLPVILNPINESFQYPGSIKVQLDKLSLPMQKVLTSSYNESQLQAISVALGSSKSMKKSELSLIQGPPGTGKTRTIIAIISALLALPAIQKNKSTQMPFNVSIPTNNVCGKPKAQVSTSAATAKTWQQATFAKRLMKGASKEHLWRRRVLVCAQSNAAVDELVSRISKGLYGDDGKTYKPYLVRVGNSKTVHSSSLPFFIDTLVEQCLAEEISNKIYSNTEVDAESYGSLHAKLEKVVENIRYYELKRSTSESTKTSVDGVEVPDSAIGAKLNVLYEQKKTICGELAAVQARIKKHADENRFLKYKIRKTILEEAEIVVATLSSCGGDLYGVCAESVSNKRIGFSSEHSLFDAVIIDEAAQAVEPATLIPLQLLKSNGTKCIIVGDPKQLPATVLSNVASKFLFESSMFERLQKAGHPTVMLAEQYRMHPEICQFPSMHFYDNKLLNSPKMLERSTPFHENSFLGPYMFYDVYDGREQHGKSSGSVSLYNEDEVNVSVEILKLLKKRYPFEFTYRKIGIITPYRSQLSLLRSCCSYVFGSEVISDIEFNTVDGFQGREVDILILSTVRASHSNSEPSKMNASGIGFVADIRRMNVALTRAKFSLWVIGNARTLQMNIHWDAFIQNSEERNLFISVSKPYSSMFFKAMPLSGGNILPKRLCSHFQHPNQGERGDRVNAEGKRRKGKFLDANSDLHSIRHPDDQSLEGYSGERSSSRSVGGLRNALGCCKYNESRKPRRRKREKKLQKQHSKFDNMENTLNENDIYEGLEGRTKDNIYAEKDSTFSKLKKTADDAKVSAGKLQEIEDAGKDKSPNAQKQRDYNAARKRKRQGLHSAFTSSKKREKLAKPESSKKPFGGIASGDGLR